MKQKCAICMQNLSKHVEAVHEKIRPFSCSICNKAFASKQMLERHFATNHKEHIEQADYAGKMIEKQCNLQEQTV